MVRKVIAFIVATVICISSAAICFASGNLPYVVDNADLLTAEQEQNLSDRISLLVAKYNYDFVIYTDDAANYNEALFAADFYESAGYGIGPSHSGSILFVSMYPDNRCYYTAATGDCEHIYRSRVINQIDDFFYDYMRDGLYYQGFLRYVDYIDTLYGNQKTDSRQSGLVSDRLGILGVLALIALGIGILIAIFIQIGYVNEMKLPVNGRATNYADVSTFRLSNVRRTFLYSTTTKVPIPQDNNNNRSGGGFSSSGGSHFSGGGRHF